MQENYLSMKHNMNKISLRDSYLHNKIMATKKFDTSFPSFSFSFNPELLSETRGWVNTLPLSNLLLNRILTQPPPKCNNSPTCLKVLESSNSTFHKANLKTEFKLSNSW